jgi:hypothetical protein
MLSQEQLDAYRRMTPGERLRLTLDLCRESTRYLLKGTPEQVERKFALLRRENDRRNENMLTAIAQAKEPDNG